MKHVMCDIFCTQAQSDVYFLKERFCSKCGQSNPDPDGVCLGDKLTLEQLRDEIAKENLEASLNATIENFKKNQF